MTSVLILGSSKGLGKDLYNLFTKNKYQVTGVSRSKGKETDYICDLSNKDEVKALVAQLDNSMPKHIVFNAGQGSSDKDLYKDREIELYNQNFLTSKFFADEVLLNIKTFSGLETLTFINSICALKDFECTDEYKKAKTELLIFAKELSKKLINNKVRVNSLLPGNIMHENSVWNKKFNNKADLDNYVKKTMPLGDWVYPEDIYNTVTFLIKNKNIVNSEIILDGGQSLHLPN